MKNFTKLLFLVMMQVAFARGFSQTSGSGTICPNAIKSEGFENGFSAASGTDLTKGLPANGTYEIVQKASQAGGGGYLNVTPHSGSYFMLIHTSASAIKSLYATTVDVVAGQTYTFCAFIANSKTDPTAGFTLNLTAGSKVIATGTAVYGWAQLCGSYTATSSGPVTFSVKDPNPTYGPSHFLALDDLCITTTTTTPPTPPTPPTTANGIIGDFVWNDQNNNGIQDAGEAGLPNVTVKLASTNAQTVTTTTNNSGYYQFSGLAAGIYTITFTTPAGYVSSPANQGSDVNKDSNPVNGAATVTIAGNETNNSVDAGFYKASSTAKLSLGNQVWNDFDGDGKHDADEPGIPGAIISLYTDNDGDNLPDGAAIKTTTSDANGKYSFTNLKEGRYIVSMPILPGFQQSSNNSTQATSPNPDNNVDDDDNLVRLVGTNTAGAGVLYTNAITLTASPVNPSGAIDATGNLTLDLAQCGNVFIGDFVWNDLNANGIQDAGEPGLNGVIVTITFADGRTATTTTDTYKAANNLNEPQYDGYYNFKNLGPGVYTISFTTPSVYTASPANIGNDNTKDSDPVNGGAVSVTIGATQSDFTIDAGFYDKSTIASGIIGDFVWKDVNKNGIQDANEPGIKGITVILTKPDGSVVTTTTDANGLYQFSGLAAGTYTVGFTTPLGFVPTISGAGNDDTKDSDANGGTVTITLGANQVNKNVDAGFITQAPPVVDCAETNNAGGYYGGFEAGNSNFGANAGSDLYNGLPRNGSYQVVSSVSDLGGGGYLNIQPKSGSYFLAAHTSNTETDRVWYSSMSVIPGQTYKFCASVTLLKNLGNGADYILGIYANGTQIGTGRVTFDWTQICGTFTVPAGVNTLELSIRDPKKGLFFVAIDDICITHTNGLTLGNYVWNDWDGDGKKDLDEYGIPQATVNLYRDDNNDNLPDQATPIATTFTDATGHYKFVGLNPGRYIVSIPVLAGYSPSPNKATQSTSVNPDSDVDDDNNAVRLDGGQVYSNAITLIEGTEPTDDGDGADGNLTMDLALCGNLWMGNYVWNDVNGDGIQDANESGIDGAEIDVLLPDGVTTYKAFTKFWENAENTNMSKHGYFDIPSAGPGTYVFHFITPVLPGDPTNPSNQLKPSPANVGTDDSIDSDPVNGYVTVTLTSNSSNMTIDAGFTPALARSRSSNTTTAETPATTASSKCNLKVAIEPKNPACYNNRTGSVISTVTGNTGKLSYSWSNGSTGANLMNVGEGKYTLTVKDKQLGCEVTSSPAIVTNPAKLVATVKSAETNGYNVVCKDSKTGIIDLEVVGGYGIYTYQWSNGATTEDLGNVPAGQYSVTVKDAAGCPVKADITLKEPATKVEVATKVTQPSCNTKTGSIALKVTGGVAPYTCNWSNGVSGLENNKLAPGVYTVTVKDAVGCEQTKQFEIKEYNFTVTANATKATLNLANGEEATTVHAVATGGTGDYAYVWTSSEALTETDKANVTVSPKNTSEYKVTVKDGSGCQATATVSVKVINESAKKGADVEVTGERVKVTPNPSNGNFNVILNRFKGKVEIKVLDASGKEVATKPTEVNGVQMIVPFSLTTLPNGMYIVNTISAEGSFKEKMIIHHN